MNSHPFSFGNLLFMHNGGLANKSRVAADLLQASAASPSACDRSTWWRLVAGDTDTELAGALFARFLSSSGSSRSTPSQRTLSC